MTVTVTRAEGATVVTVTSDPGAVCPPLCQLLLGLCYDPLCCSVSQRLKAILAGTQPVLATLHILTGLLSLGLALILCSSPGGYWWQYDYTAIWLSSLFVSFGVLSILTEKFPSRCLVLSNVVLQLTAVFFAAAAIVIYSINVVVVDLWDFCSPDYIYEEGRVVTAPPRVTEQCLAARDLLQMLLTSINAVLLVLSVLELGVAVGCFVVGVKALRKFGKDKDQSADDAKNYEPLVA